MRGGWAGIVRAVRIVVQKRMTLRPVDGGREQRANPSIDEVGISEVEVELLVGFGCE
jgi:hypothetical protein